MSDIRFPLSDYFYTTCIGEIRTHKDLSFKNSTYASYSTLLGRYSLVKHSWYQLNYQKISEIYKEFFTILIVFLVSQFFSRFSRVFLELRKLWFFKEVPVVATVASISFKGFYEFSFSSKYLFQVLNWKEILIFYFDNYNELLLKIFLKDLTFLLRKIFTRYLSSYNIIIIYFCLRSA